jgi:hypothetical protein
MCWNVKGWKVKTLIISTTRVSTKVPHLRDFLFIASEFAKHPEYSEWSETEAKAPS